MKLMTTLSASIKDSGGSKTKISLPFLFRLAAGGLGGAAKKLKGNFGFCVRAAASRGAQRLALPRAPRVRCCPELPRARRVVRCSVQKRFAQRIISLRQMQLLVLRERK
jgi:hypothetical protein